MIKYDRKGYKARARQLLLTQNAAVIVEESKIKQRIDYSNLTGTCPLLSPFPTAGQLLCSRTAAAGATAATFSPRNTRHRWYLQRGKLGPREKPAAPVVTAWLCLEPWPRSLSSSWAAAPPHSQFWCSPSPRLPGAFVTAPSGGGFQEQHKRGFCVVFTSV